MKISRAISNGKIVSFDIFDTLIVRCVDRPKTVFRLMAKFASAVGVELPDGFHDMRVQAEQKIQSKVAFPNIYDIYEELFINDSKADINTYAELEFQAELEICFPNAEIVKLFDDCIKNGQRVIVASDMYLPAPMLSLLLNKCGINGFEKIYVSCDCRASKSIGSLFKYILRDLDAKPNQIIHIGNNIRSDYLWPMALGIKSIIIDSKKKINKYYINSIVKREDTAILQSLEIFVNYTLDPKSSKSHQIGYIFFGPLLYGYASWLNRRIRTEKPNKVFFLSRDGRIMQRALELLDDSINCQYFFASRRALIVPTIWINADLENVINLFYTSRKVENIRSLMGKLGLNTDDYRNSLSKFGLDPEDRIDVNRITEGKFPQFYDSVKEQIVRNSMDQYTCLQEYLKSSDFAGDVAIVDIGWYGNMQRALMSVVDRAEIKVNVRGFYLGILPNSKVIKDKGFIADGFLFDKDNTKLHEYEKSIHAILEWIFSATHGSVVSYRTNSNDEIEPVLGQYEFESKDKQQTLERETLSEIQEGALDFIKKFLEHPILSEQNIEPEVSIQPLLNLGLHPRIDYLSAIGNLRYVGDDSHFHYLAKPKSLYYYFFHPLQLKTDFTSSGWRIGFLTRLLGIRLPYHRIMEFLRKIIGYNRI